jgi:hypothetical protein
MRLTFAPEDEVKRGTLLTKDGINMWTLAHVDVKKGTLAAEDEVTNWTLFYSGQDKEGDPCC